MQSRTRSNLARIGTTIGMAVVAMVAAAAPAAGTVQPTAGAFASGLPLYNRNSNQCLAIGGSSTDPGAQAIQWPCVGIDDQRWDIRSVPGTAWLELVNANSGQCLAIGASSTQPGAPAIQWPCAGIADQRWVARPTLGDTPFELINANSGQCLAIGGASTEPGALAVQWPCLNIPDQKWSLPIP
jgi:hypothetical protein